MTASRSASRSPNGQMHKHVARDCHPRDAVMACRCMPPRPVLPLVVVPVVKFMFNHCVPVHVDVAPI